jgi:hypothetical protein
MKDACLITGIHGIHGILGILGIHHSAFGILHSRP